MKEYIVRDNETLREIASIQLGDPNQWAKIAIMNNLDYPYIGVEGKTYLGKVVYAGDKIMLPSQNDKDNQNIYFTERNVKKSDYAELLLGIDISLHNMHLQLVPSHDGIDFKLKKGFDNIEQAVIHKFYVNRGGLHYYKKYGTRIRDYIGKPLDAVTVEFVKAEIIRTIAQDLRIENFNSITVRVDDASFDWIQAIVDCKLVGGLIKTIALRLNTTEVKEL